MARSVFWYKLLDLLHHGHMNLQRPAPGYMAFSKADWSAVFYDGQQTPASDRAWERWKAQARQYGLLVQPPEDAVMPTLDHVVTEGYFAVVLVSAAEDAIYVALGPPHASGPRAQLRCERERRRKLMPAVERGLAAAALVGLRLVG